ncbi:MAG: hypothetical protein HQK84_12075, partial [Nitrospinae bacterium]|nr:hypothetical protein [Nitrospinota bacterium]
MKFSTVNKRFYPVWLPEVANEPTADSFHVIHDQNVGYGVITKRSFRKGELMAVFNGIILPHQTLYTLQVEPGMYIEDPWRIGRVL